MTAETCRDDRVHPRLGLSPAWVALIATRSPPVSIRPISASREANGRGAGVLVGCMPAMWYPGAGVGTTRHLTWLHQ
jgi:hypothetical protein